LCPVEQGTASKQLAQLEEEWYAVSVKCVSIDGAVQGLEEQIAAIKARPSQKYYSQLALSFSTTPSKPAAGIALGPHTLFVFSST
jgi:hypothetical protein